MDRDAVDDQMRRVTKMADPVRPGEQHDADTDHQLHHLPDRQPAQPRAHRIERAVLANLAAGVAMAAGVGWLTWRYPDRFFKDACGRSLREAQRELAELVDGQ